MEDRIGREMRRYRVAARMVAHEARTKTICDFTGWALEKSKTFRKDPSGASKKRRGGPPPPSLKAFFNPARKHNEASCVAGYCRILGAVTAQRIEDAARFYPNLDRGEILCDVFESYRTLFSTSKLSFEQVKAIAIGLAQGDVIGLGRCSGCPRTILIDRLASGHPLCWRCRKDAKRKVPKKRSRRAARGRAKEVVS